MAAPATDVATELFLALLHVDPSLGRMDEHFRRVRDRSNVREAVARHLVTPTIRRHRLTVFYEDPSLGELDPREHHRIHPSLTAGHFHVSHQGKRDVWIDEIHTGWVLSTQQQLALLSLLGRRRLCRAEARWSLNTVLRRAKYPIMSLCGRSLQVNGTQPAIAGLLQVPTGRIAEACRLQDRWSQDYRYLGAVDID